MESKAPGRFIAIEGIDGSGKSTQLTYLMKKLRSMNIDCCETCEPTNLPAGRLIRSVLTGKAKTDNRVIAALFVADRLDHLTDKESGLCEKIKNGCTVVCDRYYFSSYAYNSVDMDMDWVINANSVCSKLLKPDCTLFIDIDADTALERIAKGRESTELFETKERLELVRKNYFEAFEKLESSETIIIADGKLSPDALAEEIWNKISYLF